MDDKKKAREKRKKEQSWGALDKKTKVYLTKSITDNAENAHNFQAHMAARRREANDPEGTADGNAPSFTCMGIFPSYNANPTGLKWLPATLDADFPTLSCSLVN